MYTIALILLALAAVVIVAAAMADRWISPRRTLPRFPSPGSLPRARGFEAAAERHFGNPRSFDLPVIGLSAPGVEPFSRGGAGGYSRGAQAAGSCGGDGRRDSIRFLPECP